MALCIICNGNVEASALPNDDYDLERKIQDYAMQKEGVMIQTGLGTIDICSNCLNAVLEWNGSHDAPQYGRPYNKLEARYRYGAVVPISGYRKK